MATNAKMVDQRIDVAFMTESPLIELAAVR